MKRAVKILLWASLALFIAGIAIMCTALAIGGNDMIKTITGQSAVYEDYRTDIADISTIDLDFKGKRIDIYTTEGSQIEISYARYDDESFEFNTQNGRFTATFKSRQRWYSQFVFGMFSQIRDNTVRLGIPKEYAGNLNASTNEGSVNLDSVSGLGEVRLTTSNGSIKVTGLVSQSLNLITGNGSIKTADITLTGDFNARTTNGSITLNTVACPFAELNSTNASIRIEAADINELFAATTNGAVRLDWLDTTRASFKTTNASITGLLRGTKDQYSLTFSTTNGEVSPDPQANPDAPRSIVATTTNGRISFEFEN